MKRTFAASVWREDDWYVAQCLEVDVASQGSTKEEALELYFEPPGPVQAPEIESVEVEIGAT